MAPAGGLPDTNVGAFPRLADDGSKDPWLDRDQHEQRLEAHLRLKLGVLDQK